jgi:hypothetical protein
MKIGKDVLRTRPVRRWVAGEDHPLLTKLAKDTLKTHDINTGGTLITVRNRITGQAETWIKGECSKEMIELHAHKIVAKWGRPPLDERFLKLLTKLGISLI